MRFRMVLVGVAGLVAAGIAVPDVVSVAADSAEFVTEQPSMIAQGSRTDVTITPIITVGDTLDNGYRFEAIPDGIAVDPDGRGEADVYVNHETSTVPFPFIVAGPTAANSENDFDNSQVSKLEIEMEHGKLVVDDAEFVIDSALGYQRFCSNFLATRKEGFDRKILFTNEEAVEWINTSGTPWPSGQGQAGARQAGVVVAHDLKSGDNRAIWGMGRFNHENNVAIPGYKQVVLLSGDDTFLSNPAQSQVYSYIAKNAKSVLEDKGTLWAFVSDTPGFDDYYDFVPGSTTSVTGHFIAVPRDIATGRLNGTGRDLVAADKGYPAPTAAEFTLDALGVPVDGPQWVLEKWSDANGVFQFVRIEDIAYDKRGGMGNVVYMADSGRGTAGDPVAGRSTNGRIWKMVLDPKDPTKVTSLSIFLDGDDSAVKTLGEIHQPDNLETTRNSLLVTEDPGSSQQFPSGSVDANATTSRLWRVPIGNPAGAEVVASVDQSTDGGVTDVDGRAAGNLGAWEVSGVVDASAAFGPGAFLVDVQAHTLWVEKANGPDLFAPVGPDFTYKREGGQLLLIRIPGG
jgi:Bacterial protein of unknown function (DUF839)